MDCSRRVPHLEVLEAQNLALHVKSFPLCRFPKESKATLRGLSQSFHATCSNTTQQLQMLIILAPFIYTNKYFSSILE